MSGKASALILLFGAIASAPLSSKDFRFGPIEGLLDTTVAYGLMVRTEDADDDLVAEINGGSAASANGDDGTLNYDTGIVSNMVRVSQELTARYGNFGVFARGFAFYDYENEDQDRERTDLTGDGQDMVGQDADLLDHYVTARTNVAGIPVLARLGDQVINWGQTVFIRDGVDSINPIDLVAAFQPATTTKDIFIPQGMLWVAANITENYAVEGFYQYEWKRAKVPPVGAYFSTNDAFGGDGTNLITLGGGKVSDLGTDLDLQFGLPAGTLGFDDDYNMIFGRGSDTPSDGGQYGITLRTVLPGVTATTLGVHYVRYHSRLPILNGVTADQAAIDATSQQAVDARAALLEPIYIDEGLSPEDAAVEALSTAESLTFSGYANEAGFFAEYPEDVDMIGVTFNTATRGRGVLLSGELSHHMDHPFQVDLDAVINGVLSPIQYDPALDGGVLGEFGADEVVRGYKRLDKTQLVFGIARLLNGRLGASQVFVSADAAWVHVHDMPDRQDLPLSASGRPTEDSFGYRALVQLSYNNIFGGLNLRPRLLFTHDADGNTPAPFGTFVEDRKSITLGVGADFISALEADLSYTNFFGANEDNLVNDRDFIRFRISYSF